MERLTKKIFDDGTIGLKNILDIEEINWSDADGKNKESTYCGKAIDRLAAYEDTGLTPEETEDIAKAKADGRLVVLPCKVGDTVWLVSCDCLNRPSWITENNFEYGMLPHIGKTIFLTREEAEAARKEQEK
jgi:hypothetical protein